MAIVLWGIVRAGKNAFLRKWMARLQLLNYAKWSKTLLEQAFLRICAIKRYNQETFTVHAILDPAGNSTII